MAEEITTVPEKYKLDSTEMDSNSAENPHSPSSARRHSLSDKPNTTKRRVPIHLRASTGSCHDLCKFGKKHSTEEKTREPFRKRISKSLPNKPISSKTIVSEASGTATSKLSLNGPKPIKTASSVENTKKHSSLVNISPRQSALSVNKTRSKNISCSVSDQPPEIIKREILLSPSEKVEAPVEEGSSNGNKISKTGKKASDHSVIRSASEKVNLFKANKPLVASGKKMMSAGKASEAPPLGRPYLGKTATSKAREEAGRVKLSLSSPVKHRNRTERSNGEASEKTLHVIKTETEEKAFSPKAGGVKPSSPPGRSLEIRVIKTESENSVSTPASSPLSSSRAKSPSLSPREEKNDNEKIQTTVSIENEENQASLKSLSSSSHEEDDNETIDHSNNETGELIEDKIVSSEIDNLDTNTTSSFSEEEEEEEEEEEIYPSASKSSTHSRSSSLLTLEENDEEINGELVSDKTVSTDIGKSQSSKEKRTTLRRSLSILSGNKNNCSPVKLKFRRGKIIDLQPVNNVPTRLKFRRVRNSDNNTKMGDFVSKGKKSIIPETSHVKSGTPPNRTLRKANSFISDKKRSTDIKQETQNRSLRKSRSASLEEKHRSVVSLSRREKSVDSQTDNNSPTRLKFQRGRASRVEDAKSDSWRRNIKKSGGHNEAVGFEASSRNVVLKPSEVQRKNNEQVLLNNVIEETVSKLAESRKSKVKALVGAFETVILLNETKPAASSHMAG